MTDNKDKSLTRDAKVVLYALYKEYLSRRQHGSSRADSCDFASSKSIHENFCQDMCLADVDECLRELGRNGFVNNLYAEDSVSVCLLTDFAISEMENRTKDTLLSLADFLSKFIP